MTRVSGGTRRVLAENDPLVVEVGERPAGVTSEVHLRNRGVQPLTVYAVSLQVASDGHEVTFSRHLRIPGRASTQLVAHDLGNLARIVLHSRDGGSSAALADGVDFLLRVQFRTMLGASTLTVPVRIVHPPGEDWFFDVGTRAEISGQARGVRL